MLHLYELLHELEIFLRKLVQLNFYVLFIYVLMYLIFNNYWIAKFSWVQLELAQFKILCCLYLNFDDEVLINIFNIFKKYFQF